MPNLPCETADDTIAINWAMELTAAFGRMLGEPCPFEVEATDINGEPAVRVAGQLVPLEYRSETPEAVAVLVASKLAGVNWPYQALWHEMVGEVAGFVRYMHDEFAGDLDGFEGWLEEFGSEPWKWTVEYIACRSLIG
jgi:hypothetical protein